MLSFTVNDPRCVRCGLCVQDCPAGIIEREDKAVPHIRPENEANCFQCQHCLAVCPPGAISILGRNPDASLALAKANLPGSEQMMQLVRSRRSIRKYRQENADPALLQQLLTTLANCPTGVNRRELTFSVIDDKAAMQRLRERTYTELGAAVAANRVPEAFAYLLKVVPAWQEHRRDIIFRTAPHALIVSAPADAPCAQEDVAIALAYFELLAQSAGLGTVWWGMLKLLTMVLPDLKPRLGIPENHVFYAMLFGIPAVRFARTVQRDDAAVVRRVVI